MGRTTRRRFLGLAGGTTGWLASHNGLGQSSGVAPASGEDLLWFGQAAPQWADALPLGNGRLGAMVFGDARRERIALNEDTLWSGHPRDGEAGRGSWNNPGAKAHLQVVRRMVLKDKDYRAADKEMRGMQGPYNQAYEPVGDLLIEMAHRGDVSEYRRELRLDRAVATVSYTVDGLRFVRESFVSAPAQVVVVRIGADRKGAVSARVRLVSQLKASSRAEGEMVRMVGKAPSESRPNYLKDDDPIRYSEVVGKGMHFAAALSVRAEGGTVKEEQDGSLTISGATSVVLLVGMATGFRGFDQMPDLSAESVLAMAEKPLAAALALGYARLLAAHEADHRALYGRVRLELGAGSAKATDVRLQEFAAAPDASLLALYFNLGRYLLIGSSRPGTQPANLQGIWSAELRPPWSSNWTANINVQMNYWLAETCNLSECHLPLFAMVTDLARNGARTAEVNYGAKGWVSHHNVDLWRQSAPVGEGTPFASPTWANFAMSGPWLCEHLWEHYRFTGDREFLRASYPVLKGSAEFCLSWLVEDEAGQLTTCPSVSTENSFLTPEGKSAQVSAGCTLDVALIREIFGYVVQATKVLGVDAEFAGRLAAARARLPEYKVGRFGQLQEWSEDFAEDTPGQRHMSHLYPVYPGWEITPRGNARLSAGARKSLERRLANGGAYTGWSRAWAIGLWARLGDGEMAWESLKMLMEHSTGANLFDTHPAANGSIFQIDGNFGATAGLAELLLQSHEGEISLLPALPKLWRTGSVRGLRARGGVEVAMRWRDGALVEAELLALRSGEQTVRVPQGQRIDGVTVRGKGTEFQPGKDGSSGTVAMLAGRRYRIRTSSNLQPAVDSIRNLE